MSQNCHWTLYLPTSGHSLALVALGPYVAMTMAQFPNHLPEECAFDKRAPVISLLLQVS